MIFSADNTKPNFLTAKTIVGDGVWHFAVTAYDTNNSQSAFCSKVSKTITHPAILLGRTDV